jgi:hypothetical protein
MCQAHLGGGSSELIHSVEYLHTDINISTYQYTINCLNGYKRDTTRVPYGHQQLEKTAIRKPPKALPPRKTK